LTWWLRSRRPTVIAAALGAQTIAVALLSGALVPVPSLVEGAVADLPAIVLVPLVLNSAVQYSLGGGAAALESTAVRYVARLDAALVLVTSGALVAISMLMDLAGVDEALEALRNAIGYLGIGLLAGRLVNARTGSLVPALYVFLIAIFNSDTRADVPVWKWPLAELGNNEALGCAIALWCLGLLVVAGTKGPDAL
jgi:hypothetical protein